MKDWGKDLGGRELEFRKNGFKITIFYPGEKNPTKYEYAIDVTNIR